MSIALNGASLGNYLFTTCEQQSITFDLSAKEITGGLDILAFEFGNAISPAVAGLSGDQRALAVGFSSLRFVQKEKGPKE
jgi:hypothetical protein